MPSQTVIDQVKSVWFILAFLVGMVVWYANTNTRITTLENTQQAILIENRDAEILLNEIKSQLVGIETTLEFIKNK